MDVAITKMSSKGQVVIPAEMRKGFKNGDKIFLIREGGRVIMKRVADLEKRLYDDLLFAKRTEAAFKRYDAGLFSDSLSKEFIKELEGW